MTRDILLVDDELNTLKVISAALTGNRFNVETARSGEEALEAIARRHFDLVMTDYRLPGMNGEQVLDKIKTLHPEMPVIILTAYGSIASAVNAMRKGAYTYLTKPVNLELLDSVLHEALRGTAADGDDGEESPFQFLNIIGRTPGIREVFSLIRRVSKTDANVLVLGESGTGKELVARAIHYTSLRADKPFIPIDCTTIPPELMESELFGYDKGAFTCAYDSKVGLLEMASGGTIFLDEIGDLDLPLQKKLLRFIQEREIRRVGGQKKIELDVRVVAATNRDIERAVERDEFRADLFYRLNVITITIPPLRERRDDIPLLAAHYLKTFTRANRKEIRSFDDDVMAALLEYDWPGNVRELENVVERAVILCPCDTINMECLPKKLRLLGRDSASECDELNLVEMERRIIVRALDRTGWNQSRAAELLGISRKQLRTKMKHHGLLDRTGDGERGAGGGGEGAG